MGGEDRRDGGIGPWREWEGVEETHDVEGEYVEVGLREEVMLVHHCERSEVVMREEVDRSSSDGREKHSREGYCRREGNLSDC